MFLLKVERVLYYFNQGQKLSLLYYLRKFVDYDGIIGKYPIWIQILTRENVSYLSTERSDNKDNICTMYILLKKKYLTFV